MSERAPYSRVYWSVVDDAKFAAIYDNNNHLATWLRLLIVADQAYPASAPLPYGCRKASVAALVEAGLVDLGVGNRYRVHGLEAEREKRRTWATTRGPNGDRSGVGTTPERVSDLSPKQSIDEQRLAEDDARADLEAFLLVTRRAPTLRQRKLLDGLLDIHDVNGPQWAADIILRNPADPIGAVIEADKAWRRDRIEAAKAEERPTPAPRRKPGLPQSARELLEHWQATEPKEVA